jgi:uncharacterized membrane protein
MQVISHTRHVRNIAERERWASVVAGSALAVLGLRRRSRLGLVLAAAGAEMVRRGATGHSYLYEYTGVRTAPKGQGAETTSVPYELGIRVDYAVTINKPRAEVYRLWRDLENLPRCMKHLVSVERLDDRRSRWVVRGPAGRTVTWDAEINNEIENELIGWRSLAGGRVDAAGSVQFREAPSVRGTEVLLELQYNPPGGILGAFAARMWGEEPTQQIQEDLYRFKQWVETGEVPTTAGQSRGSAREKSTHLRDRVMEASEHSFPASDAPAWKL